MMKNNEKFLGTLTKGFEGRVSEKPKKRERNPIQVPIYHDECFEMKFEKDDAFGTITYGGETFRGYIGNMQAHNVGGKLVRKFTVIEV